MSARAWMGLCLLAALAGCSDDGRSAPGTIGDPARGKIALSQYSCRSCHVIPGVTGSDVYVGRPLERMATRAIIAGKLPNGQVNLVRWIRNPQSIDAQTAMPNLGVTERDALDMSAYLLAH
jgi:cytochrome c1